ncbi:polyphenol oxidase family protein [Myxococcota bacterium]|nr:polyphenol oxidase family protein [Myxococcota bacterium]
MLRRSALLASVPGLAHGFTTRQGPDALDAGRGLDLGPGAPPASWSWVADQAGLPGAGVALLSQVHGDGVVHAGAPGLRGEGDALWTELPDLLLAVRVADCVPALVVDLDPRGRPARVAAVHAGWRGVAARVVPAALSALGSPAGRRLAAVGPCIGVDDYEVGAEVVEGLSAVVPAEVFLRTGRRPARWQVDLRAAVAWQLHQGGAEQVDVLPDCTFRDPLLHSHRRDAARAGRLAAVIGRSS